MNKRRSKVAKPIFTHAPPAWCSQLCQNSMNEDCITKCAPKRNTSCFVLKEGINLEDLPSFPQRAWQNEMTGAERQAVAGVYLKVIVDQMMGIRNGPSRSYPESIQARRFLEKISKQNLLSNLPEPKSSAQNGQTVTPASD